MTGRKGSSHQPSAEEAGTGGERPDVGPWERASGELAHRGISGVGLYPLKRYVEIPTWGGVKGWKVLTFNEL